VKGKGFILVVFPTFKENAIALGRLRAVCGRGADRAASQRAAAILTER